MARRKRWSLQSEAWELLGISPGSGRSIDEAAFALLWVGQGQSFEKPKPTEATTSALNAAIQSEVGTLVGGERARAVLGAVRTELSALLTDSGKPKSGGPLHAAIGRAEELASQLGEAEARLNLLDTQLGELASKRGERQRLADPTELARLQGELKDAELDVKTGQDAAAIVATFEATEQRGKLLLDQAERARNDLISRRDAIDEDRARGFKLAEELDPIVVQIKTAQEAAQKARDEIVALDAQADKDNERERALQRLAKCIARNEARPALVARQEALESLEDRMRGNKAALAANAASADVIGSLDKIERELSVLNARLEAGAPEVTVEVTTVGTGRVLVGGTVASGKTTHAAIDPMTIEIGDLATIRIAAPAGAQKGDLAKRGALQAQLSTLLSDAGVAASAELRAARTLRQELESENASLLAEAKAFLIEPNGLPGEIERLKTEIAEIDSFVSAELERSGLDALPNAETIVREQDELNHNRDNLRRRRRALEGTLEAQNEIGTKAAAKRAEMAGVQTEVNARLQINLSRLPDQDRERLINSAEDAVTASDDDYRKKVLALEEQRQKTPTKEELERRTNRVARLKRALDGHKDRLGTLEKEISNLEGQVQSAGGDGLGEKVDALREENALAAREMERQKARSESLTLLKETIEVCYKDQRDRLNAPLRRHLQPFLNDVFPSAELELGDDFKITGIKRQGPAPEEFDRLSYGTQEKIAVLVRLAMGAMLGERGQPVPIILDDALVFSDDDRIEQMFDALTRAGQKQQVIVLTCRVRAFAALGGRPLSISA